MLIRLESVEQRREFFRLLLTTGDVNTARARIRLRNKRSRVESRDRSFAVQPKNELLLTS